jgi:hypothetical protein
VFGISGGPGYWRNINADPDVPTSAALIESSYEAATGEPVDGVVFVDPQTLAAMLEATGPVTPPALGRSLDAGNAVDYLANQAYLEFGDQADRKRVLGAAVLSVWRRFMEGGDPVASLRALGEAASARHLLVHATIPRSRLGSRCDRAGRGRVRDLLAVHASNAAGTKNRLLRPARHPVRRPADAGGATGELT